jgi:hypothetical protein
MSKQKKDKVELIHRGVVSEEAMLAFVNNELTVSEKQELEKLLEADPFAQDAMEGLAQTENKKEIKVSIALVNKKIRERLGEKEPRGFQIHWTNYAWAAALLGLLVGIGFVMVQYFGKSDSNIAMKQKKENAIEETNIIAQQEPTKESATDIIAAETSTNGPIVGNQSNGPTQTVASELQKSAQQPNTEKNNQEQSLRADNVANPAAGTSGAAAPVQVTTVVKPNKDREEIALDDNAAKAKMNVDERSRKGDALSVAADKSVSEPSASEVTISSSKTIGSVAVEKKAENLKTASVEEAMKSFNSGDYKLASAQFDLVLKQTPDNSAALYFGGISDYINGKTAKGEKNFDKLLKSGSQYVEGSKWYKANILLKKGKKEEAQRMLLELAATNGSYKERAAKKLEEVK